jgi:TPR repeat protein
MRRMLGVALLLLSGSVLANELSDANRLLAEKSYDKAFPIYQKLAYAGNAEAQMRLGEMYWFGDATAPDLGKAAEWFQKSAAAGNADAAVSLASLRRRETHGNEIVYWTSTYQGEDLLSGKFECKTPTLPQVSTSNDAIKVARASIKDWHECYNGFVANVNTFLPPGKAIPAEVLDMMTPAEAQQAQRHLDQVYNKVIANARRNAGAFTAQESAWVEQTERYVSRENERTERLRDDIMREQRREIDIRGQAYRDPYVQSTVKR